MSSTTKAGQERRTRTVGHTAQKWPWRGLLAFSLVLVMILPDQLPSSEQAHAAATVSAHSAISHDGGPGPGLLAWGANGVGELGAGSNDVCSTLVGSITSTNPCSLTPLQVITPTNLQQVAVGGFFTLALAGDGTIWASGLNNVGQLGIGLSAACPITSNYIAATNPACWSTTPVSITALSAVTITAGFAHSLAIDHSGHVWAWGANLYGQLGIGATCGGAHAVCYAALPVEVLGQDGKTPLSNIIAVAAGAAHSLALTADGHVLAWGSNASGQLGNGAPISSSLPVTVSNLSNVVAIAAGATHNLALTGDGFVHAWGSNNSGQLGNGTTIASTLPVTVTGLSHAMAIAAGGAHNLIIDQSGATWAWGDNIAGELGAATSGLCGTSACAITPTHVLSPDGGFLTGVKAIAAGTSHSLALRNDGTVLSWGSNEFGQLGNGGTYCNGIPEVINSLSNVSAIAAGDRNSLAVGSIVSPGATPTATSATGAPLVGCTNPRAASATSTTTSTPTATATSTPIATETSTATATETSTATASTIPVDSNIATETGTSIAIDLATATRTTVPATSTPLPVLTSTATHSSIPTSVPTATSTISLTGAQPTATSTGIPAASATSAPTDSATNTPISTANNTLVDTDTPTGMPSSTATVAPGSTSTGTATTAPTGTRIAITRLLTAGAAPFTGKQTLKPRPCAAKLSRSLKIKAAPGHLISGDVFTIKITSAPLAQLAISVQMTRQTTIVRTIIQHRHLKTVKQMITVEITLLKLSGHANKKGLYTGSTGLHYIASQPIPATLLIMAQVSCIRNSVVSKVTINPPLLSKHVSSGILRVKGTGHKGSTKNKKR